MGLRGVQGSGRAVCGAARSARCPAGDHSPQFMAPQPSRYAPAPWADSPVCHHLRRGLILRPVCSRRGWPRRRRLLRRLLGCWSGWGLRFPQLRLVRCLLLLQLLELLGGVRPRGHLAPLADLRRRGRGIELKTVGSVLSCSAMSRI